MNKVICDVCGTAYPETSAQCPICGCAKTSVDRTFVGDEDGYAYVKGGRFSKKNVRSRNSGTAPERVSAPARRPQERPEPERRERPAASERQERPSRREPEQEEQSNTGLILVVIFLLIAIIAVAIYIGIRVFGQDDPSVPKDPGTSQITLPSTAPTDPSSAVQVPCESLQLSSSTIEFKAKGSSMPLQVRTTPESTTDRVTFDSSDPDVVTVDENGLLVAVGPGTATITVKCGDAKPATCTVICNFGTSSTEPTDPVIPEFTFEFNTRYKDGNKWDTTLKYGDVWTCYKNDLSVDPGAITWTSDNPAVCTIQNGIVTIVGGGQTEIHAQYAGKTYTCIVRVDKKSVPNTDDTENPGEENPGEENPGEENPGDETPTYTINKTDVSIEVGESFELKLKDANGNVVEVAWEADNTAIVTVEGNKITGATHGTTIVSVIHEGVMYSCIVRVKAPQQ